MTVKNESFFVWYKGTKAQFDAVKANYADKLVFIGNGECIYAKGNYYASFADLTADLATLTTQVNTNKNAIATLNGTGPGSVTKTVNDAIAAVVANAPEDFDTLKEIADWIGTDTTGAANMASDIEKIKTWLKGIGGVNLENDELSMTEGNYVSAGNSIEGAIDALDMALKDVETTATDAKAKADTAVQKVNGKSGTSVTLHAEDIAHNGDYAGANKGTTIQDVVSSTALVSDVTKQLLDNDVTLATAINTLFTWQEVEA